jgi:hypothetical protein
MNKKHEMTALPAAIENECDVITRLAAVGNE